FFSKRVYHIERARSDAGATSTAADWVRAARRPFLVAGGGVHDSGAADPLASFVERTGIPGGMTQAGQGARLGPAPACPGGLGVSGTAAANYIARDADLVLCVGTRLSDFTTASKTLFQHPDVRFVAVNASAFDAHKLGALPLVGDARAVLEDLSDALQDHS